MYAFGITMLLNEFFGKNIDPVKDLNKDRKDKNIGDDLFWYIVDHDKLHKKLKGHLGNVFSKELRQDMCERLLDHYREDIVNGKYKIGV